MRKFVFCFILLLFNTFIFAKDGKHIDVLQDHCDEIVMNYFYDDQEKLVFTQFLFYEYRSDVIPNEEVKTLKAWRMAKRATRCLTISGDDEKPLEFERWAAYVKSFNLKQEVECKLLQKGGQAQVISTLDPMFPHHDVENKRYIMQWQDGDVLRKVSAPTFKILHSAFDPELANRELLPKEKRSELRSPAFKKVKKK